MVELATLTSQKLGEIVDREQFPVSGLQSKKRLVEGQLVHDCKTYDHTKSLTK